jgi:hypothetical protein
MAGLPPPPLSYFHHFPSLPTSTWAQIMAAPRPGPASAAASLPAGAAVALAAGGPAADAPVGAALGAGTADAGGRGRRSLGRARRGSGRRRLLRPRRRRGWPRDALGGAHSPSSCAFSARRGASCTGAGQEALGYARYAWRGASCTCTGSGRARLAPGRGCSAQGGRGHKRYVPGSGRLARCCLPCSAPAHVPLRRRCRPRRSPGCCCGGHGPRA